MGNCKRKITYRVFPITRAFISLLFLMLRKNIKGKIVRFEETNDKQKIFLTVIFFENIVFLNEVAYFY